MKTNNPYLDFNYVDRSVEVEERYRSWEAIG